MEIKRVLIDTNIYSEFFRGNSKIIEILQTAEIIAFSVISLAELLAGFKNSKNEKKNLQEMDEFLQSPRLLFYDVDSETAEFYAKIYIELKNSGTPIPTNDLWIAALALQHGIKLLTLDSHFNKVQGLFLMAI